MEVFNTFPVTTYTSNASSWTSITRYVVASTDITTNFLIGPRYSDWVIGDYFQVDNYQIFDLTQMFGAGNEPTIEEFNAWFPEAYYEYTESKHVVIPNYREITESDSAINHIWLPSFGGMGWTIKNIFTFLISTMFGISVVGGIGEVILYLLTYWLCISLIWLVYDVIMYVPLMIHRWLDKGVID